MCVNKPRRRAAWQNKPFSWKQVGISYSTDPKLHKLPQLLFYWQGLPFSISLCKVTQSASLHRLVPSLLSVLGGILLERLYNCCRENRMCPWMFITPFWIPQMRCGICMQSVIIRGILKGNIQCIQEYEFKLQSCRFCLSTIRVWDQTIMKIYIWTQSFKQLFKRSENVFFTPLIWIWQQCNPWGLPFQW